MNRHLVLLAVAVGLAAVAAPAHAHHSHPYFYDQCSIITVEGRVERVEFKNPHSVITVRLDGGTAYIIDWAPLNTLTRTRVIGPARAALVVGTRVVVTGNPIRSATAIREHFPDYTATVNPNTVDPLSIRRVGHSFSWSRPQSTNPPNCAPQ